MKTAALACRCLCLALCYGSNPSVHRTDSAPFTWFGSRHLSEEPPTTFAKYDGDNDFEDIEMPRKRLLGPPNLDRQPQRQRQQMVNLQARDNDFGDVGMARKQQLGPPDVEQQLQLQHQQMMENLQEQHRAFMDAAWQAQMKYLTFCQETGIAAASSPARPSPPEPPLFNQGSGWPQQQPQQQQQHYGQNRPQHSRQNHQNSSQQRQGWQQRNPRRPQRRMHQQEPPGPSLPQKKPQRSASVWVNHEPGHLPALYCSVKPWRSQLLIETILPEHDVPALFRGRTLSALRLREPNPLPPSFPADCPEPRSCDVCGGTIINEVVHNKSKLHRESLEMDVELICSRIRRDPAFAAAVISAARDCVERTGLVGTAGDEDEDEEVGENYMDEAEEEDYVQPPPPAKRQRVENRPSEDAFGFLENDVFRREEVQKKKRINMGVQA